MAHLTLWQKLEFIELLFSQISELQKEIENTEKKIEEARSDRQESLVEFEEKTRISLRQKHERERFVQELLQKQKEEKEVANQIIKQIDTVINVKLSDPEQFTKLNINPKNPKEIEIVKKVLRQKLLSKTVF
jgi:regulator of replication initiation timing